MGPIRLPGHMFDTLAVFATCTWDKVCYKYEQITYITDGAVAALHKASVTDPVMEGILKTYNQTLLLC